MYMFYAHFVSETIVSLPVIPLLFIQDSLCLSHLEHKFLKSLLFIVVIQTIVSFIPVSLFKFLELTPLKFLVVPLTLLTILWSPDAVVLMRT